MTLLEQYFHSLEVERPSPKKNFVRQLAGECGVEETTIRNWILYGRRPANPDHVEILSQRTGIPVDKLWNDSLKGKE